jgi:SAM-dependent methyltransferase
VECDVRQLPIASASAELALAIEVLCYLNEDYESGLAECKRILRQGGRIMISERTWEGALLTRLLYGGVQGMLEMRHTRDMWDGYGNNLVRSRTFTEDELVAVVEEAGLRPLERKGLSLLSLVFGYLRGQGRLSPEDQQYLPDVHELLRNLGEMGKMRRTHIIVAEKVPQSTGEEFQAGM